MHKGPISPGKKISSFLAQGNANQNNSEVLSYHVRMAFIKYTKTTNIGRVVEDKECFQHPWWECKQIQMLWKSAWRFLQKLKKQERNSAHCPSATSRKLGLEEPGDWPILLHHGMGSQHGECLGVGNKLTQKSPE